MKSINVEGDFILWRVKFFKLLEKWQKWQAKIAKSLNVEAGINMEVAIYLWNQ
jgi:hypothetical protein